MYIADFIYQTLVLQNINVQPPYNCTSSFQPSMLTDLVTEVLEDSSRDTLVAHGIAEKLRHQLNSKAFSHGIVRLIRHEHHRSGHKVSNILDANTVCIGPSNCICRLAAQKFFKVKCVVWVHFTEQKRKRTFPYCYILYVRNSIIKYRHLFFCSLEAVYCTIQRKASFCTFLLLYF